MEKLQADAAIVGSGAAGLAAAVTLAEGGAKVILFERKPSFGGISRLGMGFYAVNNERMDQAFNFIMNGAHWQVDGRLVSAILRESTSTIEWLKSLGVEFEIWDRDPNPDGDPVSLFTFYMVKKKRKVDISHEDGKWLGEPEKVKEFQGGRTASMINILMENAEKIGVEMYAEESVQKILLENGQIKGITADGRSGPIKVNCKAVIIASGGYPHNKDMLKTYNGLELGRDVFLMHNFELPGNGIQMAWDIGAYKDIKMMVPQFAFVPGEGRWHGEPDLMMAIWGEPRNIWINQKGERFINEELCRPETRDYLSVAILSQKNRHAYCLFDENIKSRMEEEGVVYPLYLYRPPKMKVDDLDTAIKRVLNKGEKNIFVADSLEELANKIGVNKKALKKTIDEYNEFCMRGYDEIFNKNKKYLHPIKKPKFYAFRQYACIYGTFGGIKINEKAEVLNNEYEPIPGLYAAGDCANPLGVSYSISVAKPLTFAVNSGRIAGKNALNYIKLKGSSNY